MSPKERKEALTPMTNDELNTLLAGEPLWQTLDVRGLMLNHLKTLDKTMVEQWFSEALPDLSAEHVRGYLYMKRQ